MNIESPDSECRNDFVKVMDGDCVSRLGESKFCGSPIPPPFISTTNRLCVKFFSDDSKSDDGFLARYTAIDKPAQSQGRAVLKMVYTYVDKKLEIQKRYSRLMLWR